MADPRQYVAESPVPYEQTAMEEFNMRTAIAADRVGASQRQPPKKKYRVAKPKTKLGTVEADPD